MVASRTSAPTESRTSATSIPLPGALEGNEALEGIGIVEIKGRGDWKTTTKEYKYERIYVHIRVL